MGGVLDRLTTVRRTERIRPFDFAGSEITVICTAVCDEMSIAYSRRILLDMMSKIPKKLHKNPLRDLCTGDKDHGKWLSVVTDPAEDRQIVFLELDLSLCQIAAVMETVRDHSVTSDPRMERGFAGDDQ